MLRIAFVYAPFHHHAFQENLQVVDEDFGRMPPVSLLYAAAIAEAAGHEAIVIDANAGHLSQGEVVERLRRFRPDALAFTTTTYQFDTTAAWARDLRAALGCPAIAGGVNAALFPVETLESGAFDYAVLPYATRGLPALLGALEEGRDPAGLPEVVARDRDGKIVVGPAADRENPYESLPFPARHLIDNSAYFSFISQRRNFTVMVTGTGCVFACTYCAIAPLPVHLNPLDRVIAEVRECHLRHGIREIDFFDGDLFADRSRALELCSRLAGLGLDLEWSCRTRVDRLDEELLVAAKDAGCRQMYVGIETPNAESLRVMHKRIRLDRVRENLDLMNRIGIRPLGFFMLGVPGETHRSALKTLSYSRSLPLAFAQYSRMIAKPGSELYREYVARTGEDPWRRYVLTLVPPARLRNLWSRIDETAVEHYCKLAYLTFYYRPRYVLKTVARMRSWAEIRRSVRTAIRMLAGLRLTDQPPRTVPAPERDPAGARRDRPDGTPETR